MNKPLWLPQRPTLSRSARERSLEACATGPRILGCYVPRGVARAVQSRWATLFALEEDAVSISDSARPCDWEEFLHAHRELDQVATEGRILITAENLKRAGAALQACLDECESEEDEDG